MPLDRRSTTKADSRAAPARPVKRVTPLDPEEDGRSVVNSLAKGLRVLEAFSAERPELTLSEVAAIAKLDPGTAFRMLNTLVMLGSAMHGSDHACNRLPLALIGGGGGTFKGDQHVQFEKRWLRDLHYTVMTRMYGMTGADVDTFGVTRNNLPKTVIDEILAV